MGTDGHVLLNTGAVYSIRSTDGSTFPARLVSQRWWCSDVDNRWPSAEPPFHREHETKGFIVIRPREDADVLDSLAAEEMRRISIPINYAIEDARSRMDELESNLPSSYTLDVVEYEKFVKMLG